MLKLGGDTAVLWAGPESSLDKVIKAMSDPDIMKASVSEEVLALTNGTTGESKPSRLLEVNNGVGIVTITGDLVSTTSWWNRLMGMTSYDEIQEAMTQAATDPEVKQILLDVGSPGGSVVNLGDTAELIKMIDKKMKPVTAYSASSMSSAAYWLGSSARKIFASNTASIGSIGVLVKHIEYSKQMKKEGITPTVIRTGKFKALGTRIEPLSDLAKKELTEMADTFFNIFATSISDNVGLPLQTIIDMEGRDYIGEDALTAGLVDGIDTFNNVVQKLQKKALDTKASTPHNSNSYSVGGSSMKSILTEEQIALAAQGITPGDKLLSEEEIAAAAKVEADAKAKASSEDGGTSAGSKDGSTDTGVSSGSSEEDDAGQADSEEVVSLKAEVLTSTEALSTKETELTAIAETMATMKTEMEALTASSDSLREIAMASTGQMRIALRLASVDLSEMSTTDILREHANILKPFSAKFKVGGVAAVKSDEDNEQSKAPEMDGMEQARLGAVRIVKP